MTLAISVRRAAAATVQPLRTRALRADWPTGQLLTFDQDEATATVHLAAERGGEIVGVATVYPEPPPEALRGALPDASFAPGRAFQLRGMATADEARGQGVGRTVLAASVAAVRDAGGGVLWCNARRSAVGFYERDGLARIGPEFDVAGVGPHVVMWRRAQGG